MSDEWVIVLPAKPKGAEYVRCPSCGLIGWRTDSKPMSCPDCGVNALPHVEEDSNV